MLLLVANDFVLKARFHDAITGKLSDFAGLFAFAFFWTALVPRRRTAILILTAIGFSWWKSAAAAGFIAFWNGQVAYRIGRVIDWTDLAALVVIPLAGELALRPVRRSSRLLRLSIIIASLAAFAATSREPSPDDIGPPASMLAGYACHEKGRDFLAHVERRGIRVAVASIPTSTASPPGYTFTFDEASCAKGFTATVELVPQGNGDVNVWLVELRSNCGGAPFRHNTRVFDAQVAGPLGLVKLR